MRQFLTPEIISGFHLKKVEYGAINRVYCSNAVCSSFLYPDNIKGDKANCPLCFTSTCTICKSSAHIGDCPQDSALQQVITLATGEGWRRRQKCKAMVSLRIGSNHITCRCRSECKSGLLNSGIRLTFKSGCYVCGAGWKNCHCPLWQEARLLERAERAVAAAQPPAPIIPAQPVNPVQPVAPPAPAQLAAARHAISANHND
jgi:hypothetical protein